MLPKRLAKIGRRLVASIQRNLRDGVKRLAQPVCGSLQAQATYKSAQTFSSVGRKQTVEMIGRKRRHGCDFIQAGWLVQALLDKQHHPGNALLMFCNCFGTLCHKAFLYWTILFYSALL